MAPPSRAPPPPTSPAPAASGSSRAPSSRRPRPSIVARTGAARAPPPGGTDPLRRRARRQRARHRRQLDVLAVAQEVRHARGPPSRYYRGGQGNADRRRDADRHDDLGEREPKHREREAY